MLGVLVNFAAILFGGAVGLLVNKGIPKRFSGAIMTGIGLCVLYIGISGALQGENLIVLVVSIVLGVATGTALRLDDRLNKLGEKIEKRFAPSDDTSDKPPISRGFVAGSLLFCVGAMAIVGSINSGLTGDHTIIFTKSIIDLIAAAMLAVSLGLGILFSSVSVLVYQGLLVLLAQLLRPLLDNEAMLAELHCSGSLIIVALALNMLGLTKIKVADFLPTIVFSPIVYYLAHLF